MIDGCAVFRVYDISHNKIEMDHPIVQYRPTHRNVLGVLAFESYRRVTQLRNLQKAFQLQTTEGLIYDRLWGSVYTVEIIALKWI